MIHKDNNFTDKMSVNRALAKESNRSKKMTRAESIKSVNDHLQAMLYMFRDDIGIVSELETLQRLFQNVMKSFETVKKTRSNSNTGLGKKRFVTLECKEFIKLVDPNEAVDDHASRSYMTSLIATYVKANQLQSVEEPLYFRIDAQLAKLFNVLKYIGANLDKLEKVAELRCIAQRLPLPLSEAVALYKKRYVQYTSAEDEVLGDDDILQTLSLKENDLISWRESLKILFIVFNDGTH